MLRGSPNFRDLGGLRTVDRRLVREGALLRSGHLGELHAEDIALLRQRIGSDVCVIDLRSDAERARIGCSLPGAQVHALPIEPTVARRFDALLARGEPLSAEIARGYMADAYRNFVQVAQPQLAAFIGHAIAREGRPLLVHCAQGKDRTGFMVAMVLRALDVPRETVMEDYLLTNQLLPARDSGRYAPEVMRVLNGVRAEYLDAALDAIDAQWGGVLGYLASVASLTPQRRAALERALLEDAPR